MLVVSQLASVNMCMKSACGQSFAFACGLVSFAPYSNKSTLLIKSTDNSLSRHSRSVFDCKHTNNTHNRASNSLLLTDTHICSEFIMLHTLPVSSFLLSLFLTRIHIHRQAYVCNLHAGHRKKLQWGRCWCNREVIVIHMADVYIYRYCSIYMCVYLCACVCVYV